MDSQNNRIKLFIAFLCLLSSITSHGKVSINKIDDLLVNQIGVEIGITAWRDFMPRVGHQDGTGLMVAMTIIALDETVELPDDLNVIEAVAKHEEEIWDMTTSNNKEAYRWAVPYGYSMVFREGPRWPVHGFVDVSIVFEVGGQRHEVSTKKLLIEQTM